MDLSPGCWLGDWILEAPLGQGGFGRVFRARHGTSGAVGALKVAREAGGLRSSLGLEHPHVVRTLEEHLEHDPPFVVLELVPDGNVRELLAREGGALAPAGALEVVSHVAAALEHAHARGVLHLDVKPENVLVDVARRLYKLADFGGPVGAGHPGGHPDPTALAHSLRLTGDVRLAGTRDYAAPEVREGVGRLDRRADVYSLGVLAFELLTGRLPLGLDRPSELVATLPRALDPVLERALARAPERRTLTAGAFAAELTLALSPGPRRAQAPTPAARSRSAHLPIGLALVVGALVGGVLYQRLRPPAWTVTRAGVLAARTGPLLDATPADARVAVLMPLDLAERGQGARAASARATLEEAVARARRAPAVTGAAAAVDASALFVRAARMDLAREAGCDLVVHAVLPAGDVDQARVSVIDVATWSVVATTAPIDRAASELGRRAAAHLVAREELRAVAVLPVLDLTRGVANRTTALLDADLTAALVVGAGGRFPVRARAGIVERLRDSAGEVRRALSVGLALEGRLDAQRGLLRAALRDLESGALLWTGETPVQGLADYDVGQDMDRFTPDAAAVDRALGERLDRVLEGQVEAETARALESARSSFADGRYDDVIAILERLRARGPVFAARLEPLLLLASAHVSRMDSTAALGALEEAMAVAPDDPRPRDPYAMICEARARQLFDEGKRPWWRDDDEDSFQKARDALVRLDRVELSPARRAAIERLRRQIEDEL